MTSPFDSEPPPPSSDHTPSPALVRLFRGEMSDEDLAEEAACGGVFAYTPDDRPESPPDWRDAEIARLRAELEETKSLLSRSALDCLSAEGQAWSHWDALVAERGKAWDAWRRVVAIHDMLTRYKDMFYQIRDQRTEAWNEIACLKGEGRTPYEHHCGTKMVAIPTCPKCIGKIDHGPPRDGRDEEIADLKVQNQQFRDRIRALEQEKPHG